MKERVWGNLWFSQKEGVWGMSVAVLPEGGGKRSGTFGSPTSIYAHRTRHFWNNRIFNCKRIYGRKILEAIANQPKVL